jgi:hypothetical protein
MGWTAQRQAPALHAIRFGGDLMTTQYAEERPPARETAHEHREHRVTEATGATAEAAGAAGAVALAIIGLIGVLPVAMMAIGTIVLGAAILLDSGAIRVRYRNLLNEASAAEGRDVRSEIDEGTSAGSLGGMAGIALGILALSGFQPRLLCAVALIVFGAALLFTGAAKSRFALLSTARYGFADTTRRVIDETVGLSVGGESFVAICAIILGVLALLGVRPMTLVLVGILVLGAGMLLGGSAVGTRALGRRRLAA